MTSAGRHLATSADPFRRLRARGGPGIRADALANAILSLPVLLLSCGSPEAGSCVTPFTPYGR